MTEYVHLTGTEIVERAGYNMQSAAEAISRSMAFLDEALLRERNLRDEALDREHVRRQEALDRFESLVARLEKLSTDNADRKEAAIARLLVGAGAAIGTPMQPCERDPECTQGRGHDGHCLTF